MCCNHLSLTVSCTGLEAQTHTEQESDGQDPRGHFDQWTGWWNGWLIRLQLHKLMDVGLFISKCRMITLGWVWLLAVLMTCLYVYMLLFMCLVVMILSHLHPSPENVSTPLCKFKPSANLVTSFWETSWHICSYTHTYAVHTSKHKVWTRFTSWSLMLLALS